MHTSLRPRSSQHIEIVPNSQLYNTADRQPLPAGLVRTATPRRRVSPYPLPRPARTLASPSNSRDPSPGSSGEDIATPPDARSGSITDLDYAETSDDDDAGGRDGDVVGRPTFPPRARFTADSSCDGWSNSGADFVEEYAPITADPPAHPRQSRPSHHPSSRRSTTPAVPTRPSSITTDRVNLRARTATILQPNRITAQARTRSRDLPQAQIRPTSSVQDGTGSQAGAHFSSTAAEEATVTKIRKPPGEPGRPGSGGYNLQEKLEMSRNRYRDVMTVMNQLVEKHLQGDKSITKQAPARLAIYYEEALKRFPEMDRYEDRWPVRAFAVSHLHSLQCNSSKRATRSNPAAHD
ncbi:hypothetical protein FB107DRAFT_225120 [Schizophyllum commune]